MYYGIDFGTTNSAVVFYDQRTGRLRRIGDPADNNPLPSVISIDSFNDQVSAGRGVKNNLLKLLSDGLHLVVKSVKSSLDSDDVLETENRSWNAEQIATELFTVLASRAAEVTSQPLTTAVVAIPIGMNTEKRRILRKAAKSAGIEVAAFVSEPTAAFMAHSRQLSGFRFVLVFDWGGGTLDISVLEQREKSIIERYTIGLPKAGDYIDEVLARWAHERIAEKNDLRIPFESVAPEDRQSLQNEAERVKLNLQKDEVLEETILLGKYAGIRYVEQPITEEIFESLMMSLVNEAIDLLFESIEKSGISPSEIGKLLIVGGTSQLKLFRKQLSRRWDFPNLMFPDGAEWDIADGAAYLASNPGSYRTSESVGMELSDGDFYSILPVKTAQKESSRTVHLGLVEDSSTAAFIFSTKNENSRKHARVGELFVPCFGFMNEVMELNCNITDDLIFEATAQSSHIQDGNVEYIFRYDSLRWQYDFATLIED